MKGFRRLLVPHDFSVHADRALAFAADLAGPTGKLLVLHTIPPVVPGDDLLGPSTRAVPIEELIDAARVQLERTVVRVLGRRHPKTTLEIAVGDPYGRIMDHTRGMDAIVMSTMGRTGLSHLLIGSVAEKTVRHSPIPVLTLRPAVARRDARRRAARRR